LVGTIHLNVENVILILAALYFQCISKHWLWFELIGFILQVLSLIATFFFIPESPKFLVMQRRFTEARIILERIAKVNGTDFFMFEEDDFVTFAAGNSAKVAVTMRS
jgi:hypothetical protein